MLHLFDISTAGHLSFPIDDGGKIKQIKQMEAGIFLEKKNSESIVFTAKLPFLAEEKRNVLILKGWVGLLLLQYTTK